MVGIFFCNNKFYKAILIVSWQTKFCRPLTNKLAQLIDRAERLLIFEIDT